jgi:uncharacterized protein (DUF362 family)
MSSITRRDFVRGTAMGALGAVLGLGSQRPAWGQDPASRVVLVRRAGVLEADDPAEAVREMLDQACAALAGSEDAAAYWSANYAEDDRVGLKANVMMNHARPEILTAIHDSLTEYVGVADDHVAAWDRASGGVGREALASGEGGWGRGELFGHTEDSISRVAAEWATGLINVPSLKCHWLSGVAIGLKNWCGAVTNISVQDGPGTAFQFHGDACADIGMFEALPELGGKSRLVVVDALEPYYELGPQTDPEFFHPYGALIVGEDPVAVDLVGTSVLQGIRDQVAGEPWPINPPPKHVTVADTKYGLGTSDPAHIELLTLGDDPEVL